MVVISTDKTNFGQSLMHSLKSNMGAGILAMPATFGHCGLINAMIGMPILCLMCAGGVHLLVKSARHIENKTGSRKIHYQELTKSAFAMGPLWLRSWSKAMGIITDILLVVCQIGICCVYLVFVVDNIHVTLMEYKQDLKLSKYYLYLAIFPIILCLSCIKTLKRLAIASTIANTLQIIGLLIIIQYLIRHMPDEMAVNQHKPISEIALGFGAAIFGFEGISIAMPIYARMKRPELMDKSPIGVINVTFLILLVLYFLIGILGYLKFGEQIQGSITLNLPKEPFYDLVRVIYTLSISLSYPLQLFVLADLSWSWFRPKIIDDFEKVSKSQDYICEYICRIFLVVLTFAISMTVPKLNLVMDLSGALSGSALSLVLPALIHVTTFWNETSGTTRVAMTVFDCLIALIGIVFGGLGTYFSGAKIWELFGDPFRDH